MFTRWDLEALWTQKVSPSVEDFGVPGGPFANEWMQFGLAWGRGRTKNLDKCIVGPTKTDAGCVCVNSFPKTLTRWGVEAP